VFETAAGDFAKADAMRETLRQAGVEVFDRDKLWRAIPSTDAMGAIGSQPQQPQQPPPAPPSKNSQLQYHRSHDDHKPVDLRAVEALLEERLACTLMRLKRRRSATRPLSYATAQLPRLARNVVAGKMQRNFVRADQIRDQLKAVHNVEVHDTERVWHVSRGGGGPTSFTPSHPADHPSYTPGGAMPLQARGAGGAPGARGLAMHANFDGDFSEARARRGGPDGEERHARRERERSRSRSRSPKRRQTGFSG
jgi:hypothetical protein